MYGGDRKKNVRATIIYSSIYAVLAIVMSCVFLYEPMPLGGHVILLFLPLSCLLPLIDIMLAQKKVPVEGWIDVFMGNNPGTVPLLQRIISFDTLWLLDMFSIGCSFTLTYSPGTAPGSIVIACSTFVMVGIIHGVHAFNRSQEVNQVPDDGNSLIADDSRPNEQVEEDFQGNIYQGPINGINEGQHRDADGGLNNNGGFNYEENNNNVGGSIYNTGQTTGILGFEQLQTGNTEQYGDINGMDTFKLLSKPL